MEIAQWQGLVLHASFLLCFLVVPTLRALASHAFWRLFIPFAFFICPLSLSPAADAALGLICCLDSQPACCCSCYFLAALAPPFPPFMVLFLNYFLHAFLRTPCPTLSSAVRPWCLRPILLALIAPPPFFPFFLLRIHVAFVRALVPHNSYNIGKKSRPENVFDQLKTKRIA